jgi:hypothetical protein
VAPAVRDIFATEGQRFGWPVLRNPWALRVVFGCGAVRGVCVDVYAFPGRDIAES